MKLKIYRHSFDVHTHEVSEFIDLMQQQNIIVFDVTKDVFDTTHEKLQHELTKHNYNQGFFMTEAAKSLFYYKPADYSKEEVDKFLKEEIGKNL
jgi:hypothetical protein